MRIDLVITGLEPGGAERCLTTLAIGLHRRGHEVRVWSLLNKPTGPKRWCVNRLDDVGVQVETLGVANWLDLPKAYARLHRSWVDREPDVVQSFLHHANVLAAVSCPAMSPTAWVAGIRVAQPRPLRSGIERMALRRATKVVCVSQSVEQFARKKLGVRSQQSVVIENSVDVKRFANAVADPAMAQRDDGGVSTHWVVMAGRLGEQKN